MSAKNLVITGSAIILLSLFLPAATISAGFLSRSMNGYETDLVFSGIAGGILLLIGLSAKPQAGKTFSPFGIVLAVLGLINTTRLFINVSTVSVSNSDASTSIGLALPLCVAGCIVALIGSAKKEPGEAPVQSVVSQ